MEKSLLNLLEKNSRVIIPDLGAFIIRQKDPYELVFNDLLAFNDGMLSEYIEKSEGISSGEAESRIAEYVESVKNRITKGEDVVLGELGSLAMDESGKIVFLQGAYPVKKDDPGPATAELLDGSFEELASVEGPGEQQKENQEVMKSEPEDFILGDASSEIEVDASGDAPLESEAEEPPFTIEEGYEEENAAETRTGIDPGTGKEEVGTEQPWPEPTPAPKPDSKSESVQESRPEYKPTSNIPTYVTRKEERRFWPWIVGAASLLVVLVAAAWLIYPEKVNNLLSRKAVIGTDVVAGPVEESSPAEEASRPAALQGGETGQVGIQGSAPQDMQPPSQVQETAPGAQYYVVAGLFRSRHNAEAYVNTLVSKGYDSRIFGMRKGMHAVCFSSHPGRQEALAEMNRIRIDYDPTAWVLYY